MKITKYAVGRLFFIFCAALIAGCGGGGSSSGGGDTGGSSIPGLTKIVILADSIGTGAGVVPRDSAFPSLLRAMTGVTVVDDSVGGRQAAAAIGSARTLVSSEQPSHLIVLLGTNDANNGNPSTAISSLRQIVDIGNSAGVTVIVGTLPRFTRDPAANARAGEISGGIRGLNARIAEIRNSLGPDAIASDGFHPNAAGQQTIADLFFMAL